MLSVDVEYKKGVLFLRLIGKLNYDTKDKFIEILNLISKVGFKYVMINFEKLYSIDDYGINMILKMSYLLNENRGKIFVCGYNNLIKVKIESSKIVNYAYKMNSEIGAFKFINI